MNSHFPYFSSSEPSRGHTAIYKIHKYFARRPHNQFRALIEHYVPEKGLVLDCFSGGGVTLVEGLTVNRRVVSVDANPIAALVQRAQVNEVPASRIIDLTNTLAESLPREWRSWFTTACPRCCEEAHVRWLERAYVVVCPACCALTSLSNANRAIRDGKARPGLYECSNCSAAFPSVGVPRVGSDIISIRFRCARCSEHANKSPDPIDIRKSTHIEASENSIANELDLRIPSDPIPLTWDRQAEDALSRKGFRTFADFFTPRNRLIMAALFQQFRQMSSSLSEDEAIGVLTVLSALLRYVNNMTFSTSSWMDGRPVAWAQHAYWTPNQFVEVNPFEYLRHRQVAIKKAEADRLSRFSGKRHSVQPADVVAGRADYSIICADARTLDLPDSVVDAVITDPPFGSNVQYGELTHFWSVWLRDLNPYKTRLFDLSDEIVVHRRVDGKTFSDYQAGLTQVFQECYRVLKPDGVLVITFNNRVAEAWYAVMRAAFDAGFSLEPDGVQYIDEIRAYRDTVHLRYDRELQGDVLYTFRKTPLKLRDVPSYTPKELLARFVTHAASYANQSEMAIALHLETIRRAAIDMQLGRSQNETLRWLELLTVVSRADSKGSSLVERCERWMTGQE